MRIVLNIFRMRKRPPSDESIKPRNNYNNSINNNNSNNNNVVSSLDRIDVVDSGLQTALRMLSTDKINNIFRLLPYDNNNCMSFVQRKSFACKVNCKPFVNSCNLRYYLKTNSKFNISNSLRASPSSGLHDEFLVSSEMNRSTISDVFIVRWIDNFIDSVLSEFHPV